MRLFKALLAKLMIASALVLPAHAQTNLSDAQLQTVEAINQYLNGFRTAHAAFEQIGPNGERALGEFIMERPGKIRFEYEPPARLLIVSDGGWVGIENQTAGTMERYPLSRTPLKFLLADQINLAQDTNVIDVFNEGTFATVTVQAKDTDVPGKLTLIFEGEPMQLKRWIVTDAQGYDITVNLEEISFGVTPRKHIFVIPDRDLLIQPDSAGR